MVCCETKTGVGGMSLFTLNGCTPRTLSKPNIASACSCVSISCSHAGESHTHWEEARGLGNFKLICMTNEDGERTWIIIIIREREVIFLFLQHLALGFCKAQTNATLAPWNLCPRQFECIAVDHHHAWSWSAMMGYTFQSNSQTPPSLNKTCLFCHKPCARASTDSKLQTLMSLTRQQVLS